MSANTKIEWTDATWNPVIGCSRVSEGCRNCYAERHSARFSGGKGNVYSGLTQIVNGRAVWTGKIAETKQLLQPLGWRKPKRVFVNSMSDLFHENVTDEMRDRIFAVMALSWKHVFQILTKRPERMLEYMRGLDADPGERLGDAAMDASESEDCGCHVSNYLNGWSRWAGMLDDGNPLDGTRRRWPLPNVWLGVSVESQAAADERIPLLLATPAAVRFISAEPLLGPVSIETFVCRDYRDGTADELPRLDWVICGGESGPGARPMYRDWARSLRDQCVAADVPFFFKQWGEWVPLQADGGYSEWKSRAGKLMDRHGFPDFKDSCVNDWRTYLLLAGDDTCVHQRVGKKAAGRLLDGREWNEFPAQAGAKAEG